MSDRLHRFLDASQKGPPSKPDSSPPPDEEPLSHDEKTDMLERDSADAGERSGAVRIAKSGGHANSDSNENYAQVGEQVASVLGAAHQAAEEIRKTALEEAERIRDEAREDAASMSEEARRAAERTRRESEALRAEADEYSKEARESADRYVAMSRQQVEDEATEQRAEVERQAREMQRAAERRARTIETEALQRRKAIIEEGERSEARLEQLLGVFRGMTSQLEDVLQAEQDANDAGGPAENGSGEDLAEELQPRRSRTGSASGGGSS